jgi:hypothetical protein
MLGAWGANTSTVGQIQFYVSSSDGSVNGEIMRVTGSGLGIGTSSPSANAKLHIFPVSGNAYQYFNAVVADTEAAARAVTDVLNNSTNRGTNGAANLVYL